MKKLWCFALLFAGFISVYGQQVDRIRELQLTAVSGPDSTKFQSYIDLCFAYTSRDMDSAFRYSRMAEALLPVLPEERYQAAVKNAFAILHYYESSYDSALNFFKQALTINRGIGRINGVGINYTQIGSVYHMKGNADSAAFYQRKAIAIYEQLKDTVRLAASTLNLGASLENQGFRKDAINLYFKALALNRAIGHSVNEVKVLKRLGRIYQTSNEINEARRVYLEAIRKAEVLGDVRMLANLNSAMGSLYFEASQLDSAKVFYAKSLSLNQQIRKKPDRIINYHLGKIAQIENDIPTAIRYFSEAHYFSSVKNDSLNMMHLAIELGRSYAAIQDRRGVVYLKRAEEILLKPNFKNFALAGLLDVSKIYQQYRMFEEALSAFTIHKNLSDSLVSAETLKEIAELKQANEVYRKEQIIKQLEVGKEASETRKNLYFTLFLLVMTITAASLWAFFYRKKKNDQLNKQKQLLAEERIARLKLDLENYTDTLIERNKKIDTLVGEVNELKEVSARITTPVAYIAEIEELTQSSLLTNEEWKIFKKKFNLIYPTFFDKLYQQFSEITNSEEKIFALLRLHLSNHEIGDMLGISAESVKVARYRLRKKLKLNKHELKKLINSM
ncbi:MAG: tetratricopeptide repeat protein [Bacteroidota bacterium]